MAQRVADDDGNLGRVPEPPFLDSRFSRDWVGPYNHPTVSLTFVRNLHSTIV